MTEAATVITDAPDAAPPAPVPSATPGPEGAATSPAAPVPSPRQLGLLLLAVGLLMSLLWLDSLERYLGARYHLALEEWRPEALALPSRTLARWMGRATAEDDAEAEPADATAGQATAPAQPRPGVAYAALHDPLRPRSPARDGAAPTDATPSAVVAASAPGSAGKPVFTVQPLPEGKFWPSQRNQRLAEGPQRVLFAGDSMMQGVAPLVIRELAKRHPDWFTLDESRQSTGLTVKRYFDWPARIIELIDQKKLTLVVVFLGPNDPWDIYEPGRHIVFPSPQWEQRYAGRVDDILDHAKARGVRVIWLGLPSMRDGRVRDGAIVQNHIFAARARVHGTDYLTTEDLIGPLSLPFKRYLDDPARPETQALNLRAADGIHFTAAGQQKVAQALLTHLEAARPPAP